ncbi:MAG TPA: class I SAM-dependent methyltransferase [Thermoflexia bacterium]|jgi:SAM-dependent methyltransferase|nr:class I SAM-dependent methyltransferase [Thermoflexia bacterium]
MLGYDLDAHVAEIYDRLITMTEDIGLLRQLIGPRTGLRVLEPFCGTGRILIPLALDGHTVVGMDRARAMLARARTKVSALPSGVRGRITLLEIDVLQGSWPGRFDLVVLGGNCLYELATPEEQAQVVAAAADALRPGGYLFVDNDHMEGELDRSWYDPPMREPVFPTGECADGTRLESRWRVVWYDAPRRLIRFLRRTRVTLPDGSVVEREYLQQKHPVSAKEVEEWLTRRGLTIERMLGDYEGRPYTHAAPRAIFWARKGG